MINLNFGDRKITTEKPAFVMGILNATPDSFYSESRGGIEKAKQLILEGADILDIGGESTRPGFTEVSEEEEIKRVIPLIKEIRNFSNIPISVDTRKAAVIKAAFEAGADALNDVSALEDSPGIGKIVADYNKSVILMHRFNGDEATRVTNPKVTEQVSDYLLKRCDFAIQQGILSDKIIVDPGIGFGKTFEENLLLIKQVDKLCDKKYPILMALSRKRCIGQMTNQTTENRMVGTVTADILSVLKGAIIIRVHDVKAAVDSLNVMKYLS